MDPQRDEALLDALRGLIAAARDKPELRRRLHAVARWLADELADAHHDHVITPHPVRGPTVIAPPPLVSTTLNLGGARLEGVRVPGTPEEARAAAEAAHPPRAERPRDRADPADLSIVSRRARLKGEACRWAVERRQRVARGADFLTEIKPADASLVERARALPDCYLWMLDPRSESAADSHLEALSGCYDTLALAADIAAEITAAGAQPPLLRDLYWLVAEAQSALRRGVLEAGQRMDRDQMDLFAWLRERTFAERVFVERHMKVDDPADPANWRDLARRLAALRDAWDAARHGQRESRELRNRAAYHAHRLSNSLEPAPHDWAQLAHAIDSLVARGVAPSSREITDLLAPLLDRAPADEQQSPPLRQALAAARRLVEARADADEDDAEDDASRERSPQALAAAELLRGRVAILIGGDRRRAAEERLVRDLELAELRWIATDPHESTSRFEPEVARPEVDLVLLAIRWSSHSYGEVQEMCERHGKVFVRLPAGYSPNQVAAQVLDQASERLRRSVGVQ